MSSSDEGLGVNIGLAFIPLDKIAGETYFRSVQCSSPLVRYERIDPGGLQHVACTLRKKAHCFGDAFLPMPSDARATTCLLRIDRQDFASGKAGARLIDKAATGGEEELAHASHERDSQTEWISSTKEAAKL